ncbi:transporter [Sulfurimonas sp. SAG-AH-194-I05]|nr:transporter [Sulfurimonas sp. SAG-AH-194-I05]MDF1876078.1 transporter [Sulfurimonas sp. SAG-AH-194-I05]
MKYFHKVTLIFLFTGTVASLADTIVPDRPGFSTGTYTVQPKNLNIELGYNYTKNNETLPLVVLRTGLSNKLELDIMYDGFNINHNDQKQLTWSADFIVGIKYRLYESELYNLTFMGLTSLPVGDNRNISSKNITPLIGLLWDYTLYEDISLFGTLQGSTYYDNERIYDFQPAIGVSLAHTDKFGTYLEYYSIIHSSNNQDTQQVIGGGFTYLLSDDIQLDINTGLGLNSISDNSIGFGIAMQF